MSTSRISVFSRDNKFRMNLQADLPPSDNLLYAAHRNRKILTVAGKKFKNKIKGIVAAELAQNVFINISPGKNSRYEVKICIYFKVVENKTWSKNSKVARYKKIDAQNHQKLIIDAVTEAIGIEDSTIFELIISKRCDPMQPRIEVGVYELDN